MKVKITDLMDLYEDRRPGGLPAADAAPGRGEQRAPAQEKGTMMEVKQSKHPYGWRQVLSLAAALVLIVAGGFGFKLLLDRSGGAPTGGEAASPGPGQTLETRDVQRYGWEPLAGEDQETLSRLLTCLAQQTIDNLSADLATDGSLIHFAFVWRRNYDCETIEVLDSPDGLCDTLTPEQINETLERLLGKRVEAPADGADFDYSGMFGEAQGSLYFREGRFWDHPTETDTSTRFALATEYLPDVSFTRMEAVRFTVYAASLLYWPDANLGLLPALTTAEAEALAAEGKLVLLGNGIAELEQTEAGYRLKSYSTESKAAPDPQDSPEDLHTRPTGFDPLPAEEAQDVNRLLTVLAQEHLTDDSQLSDEYTLIRIAYSYLKAYVPGALGHTLPDPGTPQEYLTLEQVNTLLQARLGRTVSPVEGTDYSPTRSDDPALHDTYRDWIFWFPAADGEIHTRFALCSYISAASEDSLELGFTVYEANVNAWPDYVDLYPEPQEVSVDALGTGLVQIAGSGTAAFTRQGDELVLERYNCEWYDPVPMQTDDKE